MLTALNAAGAHAQSVSSCNTQCQPCNNCVSEQQQHALHKSHHLRVLNLKTASVPGCCPCRPAHTRTDSLSFGSCCCTCCSLLWLCQLDQVSNWDQGLLSTTLWLHLKPAAAAYMCTQDKRECQDKDAHMNLF